VTHIAPPRNASIEAALADVTARYADANPRSAVRHQAAARHLPGGNTRTNMFYTPFPLTIVRGEGATLTDLDGHRYTDFLGEYTAGIFGHSDPKLRTAIVAALDEGINLGGPNRWEAELALLMCERFPSLDKVRFCNSGTEANLYAISTARAVTGRSHVLVFEGAYHGGVFAFAKPTPLNAPFPFVLAPYNDSEATRALIRRHAGELAAVVIEPVVGSGGGIQADRDFLQMLRDETRRHGIALIFDEVMTSRLSPGGMQARLGILPDLTSFGKYLGGGLTFGAFGGAEEMMRRYDPSASDALVHSGTYNNNVLAMAAGVVGLRDILTPEAVDALNARGDRLRDGANQVFERHDVAMRMCGLGSINVVHFARTAPRRPTEVQNSPDLQALFHLEMLGRGIYLARRGMSALSLPLTDRDVAACIEALDDFCGLFAPLLRGDAALVARALHPAH